MAEQKGSGLDVFDSLTSKAPDPPRADPGVDGKQEAPAAAPAPPRPSKPPPPPPSFSKVPAPPPSSNRTPPPPPISLSRGPAGPPSVSKAPAPPPSVSKVPGQPSRSVPPPPPSLRAAVEDPPTVDAGASGAAPATDSSPRLPPPPSLPRIEGAGGLNAYSGDAEDDAPTRLYDAGDSSRPPPPAATMPRNERPLPQITSPGRMPEPPTRAPERRNTTLLLGGLAALGAAAALLFWNRTGSLILTVSGPGGRAVDGVEVFLDGEKRCSSSPCRIDGLSAGAHLVRASAKGYERTADQAVSVTGGAQSTQNVNLVPATGGTGVRVSAVGSGLKLFVDGREIGELPQTVKDLEPGDHVLRVGGNDRYETWEQRVTLDEDELETVGPLKLKVKKGLATFKPGPGASGARVLLDGRLVPDLPSTVEVPADHPLTLVATKSGFSAYRRSIDFEDGVAEKTFEITMVEGSGGAEEPAASQPGTSRVPGPGTGPTPAPSRAPARGKAVLNMNSIPVTTVILNGKPLGSTPKIGVQVAPGPQTVVFMHPKLGRKVMNATVAAGETKTFMARLP